MARRRSTPARRRSSSSPAADPADPAGRPARCRSGRPRPRGPALRRGPPDAQRAAAVRPVAAGRRARLGPGLRPVPGRADHPALPGRAHGLRRPGPVARTGRTDRPRGRPHRPDRHRTDARGGRFPARRAGGVPDPLRAGRGRPGAAAELRAVLRAAPIRPLVRSTRTEDLRLLRPSPHRTARPARSRPASAATGPGARSSQPAPAAGRTVRRRSPTRGARGRGPRTGSRSGWPR